MIESAAVLFREHGYSGTGLQDVIDHSGAPRGSINHHFPGGTAQLAAEATGYAGEVVARRLERAAAAGDPRAALRAYTDWWRAVLEESRFRAGCPVVAVAVEADDDGLVARTAGRVFERWQEMFARLLTDAGVEPARADRLAALTVSAFEGAVVVCRAQRSTRPLEDVTAELGAAIESAQRR
jgi:AcrR family transcriptional regulator